MNTTAIKSSVITIIILVIVCLVAGLYWSKPQWSNYSQISASLKIEETKNNELQETLTAIQTFLQDYDKQEENKDAIDKALPVQNPNAASFVSSLGQLAQASGIVLSNLQISTAEKTAEKAPAPYSIQGQKITFTATGSYLAFKDFVLRLENHLRLIDINHVSVAQNEAGQPDYQVDLTTYYQN